uniref:SH3 and cysteine rich domain n=1 Tax=Sinocyclocheilus rhinocerous TaxID=307959 RepID=A0A673KY28_9TELE
WRSFKLLYHLSKSDGNRCILYSVLCLFQLQRLKRSLSFKTKSLRSKSADNFFQRPIEDVKFQTELLSDVSSSTGHLSIIGVSVSASPAMSLPPPPPPLPTIIPGNLPITICSPSRAPRPADPNAHTFLEHIFKKPHFCDVCNHMIVGTNAKLGLRCKACKMGIHNKCLDRVGQQRCMGKLPKGFRRYSSSPLIIKLKVHKPVDFPEVKFSLVWYFDCDRCVIVPAVAEFDCTTFLFTVILTLALFYFLWFRSVSQNLSRKLRLQSTVDFESPYMSIAKFQNNRIILADDSNDDWWKGVIEDRIGYFPASFAHQVRAGDRVFRCNRTFIGCKEQGQITLKEGQICVSGEDEHNGFIRVASGKKRGFVPCDVLENI